MDTLTPSPGWLLWQLLLAFFIVFALGWISTLERAGYLRRWLALLTAAALCWSVYRWALNQFMVDAINTGDYPAAQGWLARGASPNAVTWDGRPVVAAVARIPDDPDAGALLAAVLDRGAEPRARDWNNGTTAADLAAAAGNEDAQELLAAAGGPGGGFRRLGARLWDWAHLLLLLVVGAAVHRRRRAEAAEAAELREQIRREAEQADRIAALKARSGTARRRRHGGTAGHRPAAR